MKELCRRHLAIVKKDSRHYTLAMPEYKDIIAKKFPIYEVITYRIENIQKHTKGVAKGSYSADVIFYGEFASTTKGHSEVAEKHDLSKCALSGIVKSLALGKKKLAFGESTTIKLDDGVINKADFLWLANNGFSWSFEKLGTLQPKITITRSGCIDSLEQFQALPTGRLSNVPMVVRRMFK